MYLPKNNSLGEDQTEGTEKTHKKSFISTQTLMTESGADWILQLSDLHIRKYGNMFKLGHWNRTMHSDVVRYQSKTKIAVTT